MNSVWKAKDPGVGSEAPSCEQGCRRSTSRLCSSCTEFRAAVSRPVLALMQPRHKHSATASFCGKRFWSVSMLWGQEQWEYSALVLPRTNLSSGKQRGGHSTLSPAPWSSTLLWLHHLLWNGQSKSSGFERHRQKGTGTEKVGIQLVLNQWCCLHLTPGL